jgi:diguanylate cyclase (GGDEF)-like protein
MIVDRSEVARSIISHILRKKLSNAYIVDFGSAEEALERLEQEKYDLITTALFLPGLDGLDLCHEVRNSEKQYLTPVVVVSSDADRRLLREGFSAGVTDYFNKSLGYEKLVEFISDVLQRHAGLVGKLLYIEDSFTHAQNTIQLMQNHGLHITHLSNAEAALDLLKQPRKQVLQQFDMVFTDFFLSKDMSGGDLLYAIRSQLHFSQQELPVLVITIPDNDCQADIFHAGANDFITKPLIEEIFIARVKSLLLVRQQYNIIKRYSREMYQLSTTDAITRVKNKKYLLKEGTKFIKKYPQLCLLIIDIDQIEDINHEKGHLEGDYVLYLVAQTLMSLFARKGLVARFFGKHFVVLLPDYNLDSIIDIAEALRKSIAALEPDKIAITASIGIASSEERVDYRLEDLLVDADNVLRIAKIEGGNVVCLYTTDNNYCLLARSDVIEPFRQ